MQIHHYHPDTGIYQGSSDADADPLEPGRWLIPANSTTDAPPSVPAGQRAKWTGAAWALEAIPAPPPEPAQPTAAEIRRGEILAALHRIDSKSIRALREGDAARVADWEANAATLRAELATL